MTLFLWRRGGDGVGGNVCTNGVLNVLSSWKVRYGRGS